jgi:histidinol-phosphatase (PHP family)
MEEMCLAAINEGVSAITITDHCDVSYCVTQNSYMSALGSVTEARRLGTKYKDKLFVGAGLELSGSIEKPKYSTRLIKAINPDCVVASVHGVTINNLPTLISRMDFGSMTDSECYDVLGEYFSVLARTVVFSNFDVCAHLTLPLRYTNGVYGKNLTLERFEPIIEKILSILIERKKALEINTSDIHHQLCDFMPSESIVQKYYQMGGRLITIGTDAHLPQNISHGFSEAKEMLHKIGFYNYNFYKRRKPVSIPL